MYYTTPNATQAQGFYSKVQSGNQRSSMQQKVIQHQNRSRFIGLVYACLIFVFVLMACSTLLSMYSRAFRHFIHHKITVIVLGVLMGILSLLLLCCEQAVKGFQSIYFIIYSIGLALLAGAGVTHLKSMIVVFTIFLILVLVIGLATFAFTTSNNFGDATSYLSVVGIVAIGLGIFALFWKSDIQPLCYASVIAMLFGFYLVYYTQTIASKYGNGYDDNDYFLGALSIFVQLVQLAAGMLGMSFMM